MACFWPAPFSPFWPPLDIARGLLFAVAGLRLLAGLALLLRDVELRHQVGHGVPHFFEQAGVLARHLLWRRATLLSFLGPGFVAGFAPGAVLGEVAGIAGSFGFFAALLLAAFALRLDILALGFVGVGGHAFGIDVGRLDRGQQIVRGVFVAAIFGVRLIQRDSERLLAGYPGLLVLGVNLVAGPEEIGNRGDERSAEIERSLLAITQYAEREDDGYQCSGRIGLARQSDGPGGAGVDGCSQRFGFGALHRNHTRVGAGG